MKKNIGSADKVIRLIIAAIIAVLYFTHIITGIFGIVLIIFAAGLILTCFMSFCTLYLPFGINTIKKKC